MSFLVRFARVSARTLVPSSLRQYLLRLEKRWKLIRNYRYDFRRYARYSGVAKESLGGGNLEAELVRQYHAIEKGLALSKPRPGFGLDRVHFLQRLVRKYLAEPEPGDVAAITLNVIDRWRVFNQGHGIVHADIDARQVELRALCAQHAPATAEDVRGGTIKRTRAELAEATAIDYERFVMTRHSVRQFAPRPVDRALIERAARLAQRTPSVCNRQGWGMHIYDTPEQVQAMLKLQTGNRGFTEEIGTLIVLTGDVRRFLDTGERNQCWVDGGMFAMATVLALHSVGLGSCCLNWCTDFPKDIAAHKTGGIADHEVILMYLAVGHPPEEFEVAESPRRPLEEVARFHPETR